MAFLTDTEIKQTGLAALVATLGEVDAARFITLLNRDQFDYTQWQKTLFANVNINDLSSQAIKAKYS